MKILLILISVLLVMNTPMHAAQLEALETFEEVHGNFHRYTWVSDAAIPLIMGKVSQLLDSGTDPKKIVFIFDVDGTLTDEQMPSGGVTYPRSSEMINFVRALHSLGVTMIASSAWDQFDHTVGRIRALGLCDVFQAKGGRLPTKEVSIKGRALTADSLGNIISVRDTGSRSNYYRAKFISTFFADDEMAMRGPFPFSHIFFLDDSDRNVDQFMLDFEHFFPTQGSAQESPIVFAYLLTPPLINIKARQTLHKF
ncbi:MAG: hypothetical protein NT128_07250 [Proteobacteria bacterium]|nr:hypothetical protein [Pseudomonadota bacterium]